MRTFISIGSADEQLIKLAHGCLECAQTEGSNAITGVDWEMDINVDNGGSMFYTIYTWVENTALLSTAYIELATALRAAEMAIEDVIYARCKSLPESNS